MRVDGPLGEPRRARGVHDVELVVVAGGDLGLIVRRVRDELVVVAPNRPSGSGRRRESARLAHADELPQIGGRGAPVAELLRCGAELAAVDQNAGAAVLQDEGKLVGNQAPVERHADGSELRQREEGLHELHAVHQQQGHAIALGHAQVGERVGGAVAAQVELAVQEAPLAARIDPALEPGTQVRALAEQQTHVLLHDPGPPPVHGWRAPVCSHTSRREAGGRKRCSWDSSGSGTSPID